MLENGKIIAFERKDDFRQPTDPHARDFIDGRAPENEDVRSQLSS